jgi:hypothetical protein
MADDWKGYQEEAASFFRSLGLDASTDVTVTGVRTSHDVDVLVKSTHVGFEIIWIVECKQWKTRVSKLHVLALREIVLDVGADRGILLSEAGFQNGAVEAATLTNVKVTSLAEASVLASNDIYSMRLRDLFNRVEDCNDRYCDISKEQRIEHGLRPDVGEVSYNGRITIDLAKDLLSKAFRGRYPFTIDSLLAEAAPIFLNSNLPSQLESPREVFATVEPMVEELERRLNEYDATH